jgi:hypothetical protein
VSIPSSASSSTAEFLGLYFHLKVNSRESKLSGSDGRRLIATIGRAEGMCVLNADMKYEGDIPFRGKSSRFVSFQLALDRLALVVHIPRYGWKHRGQGQMKASEPQANRSSNIRHKLHFSLFLSVTA